MPSRETGSADVNKHYAHQDLDAAILGALLANGTDLDRLTSEDLAPIDEFHIRGRKATVALARDLVIDPGMQVLDVGCGLGGAARYLAREFGCRVTGLDLNPDYCRVAADFTRRLALDSLVSFRQGDAVALPFPDASFDLVWTQHTAMNISDKSGFYREVWRVLKSGGHLAIYDVLAGAGGTVHFPVPWARYPSISFLLSAPELLAVLAEAGFEIRVWRDVTESGRSWFRHRQDSIRQNGLPPFGLQLLLGPDFSLMAHNQLRNLEENRIALIEAVVRRS